MVAIAPIVQIQSACDRAPIGKRLPDAFYIHISALPTLAALLQDYEQRARQRIPADFPITLVKFSLQRPQISYLAYPHFDDDPHPCLSASVQVDLATGQVRDRDYRDTANPPLLHRKETFVAPDYPAYAAFAHLTRQQEALGLLANSRAIGTRLSWEQRLAQRCLEIHNYALACSLQPLAAVAARPKIERHKAAIARANVSKPVRLAVEAGLFEAHTTYFDYGCGHGTDIDYIRKLGHVSAGWDPYFCPDPECTPADVVNLGYVINVIEDTAERREALIHAWGLAQRVLIVAAQVLVDDRVRGLIPYGDGIITSRNTFQKYYEQEELKAYIDQVLGVDAVPVALGIYFVFRDEGQAENFRAARFRSRTQAPQIRLRVSQFERYREQLQPLMDFYADRGRLPTAEEMAARPAIADLKTQLGSLKRAFRLVRQATDAAAWDAIADRRRNDLLVYLALSQFGQRPRFRDLSASMQADIKGLFGSYQQACAAADLMLMSLGRTEWVADRCCQSPIGQQRPNSLWVHVSALDQLDPLLRLYEGCASRTLGRPEEATVIKFSRNKPRITYLMVPTFGADPHPPLRQSMTIDLQDLRVRYRDYNPDNPPLLHQKEQLLTADYPDYAKFAKLSQQERRWGLLDDLTAIVDCRGWQQCLAEHCAELRGHRVVWRKDADPYRKKVVQAAMRSRQRRARAEAAPDSSAAP